MDSPDLDFAFVEDTGLLTVLERYYEQTQEAAGADSY
jgi:hypothetical protein